MESTMELRDFLAASGVDSPSRVMAVGSGGRILFKKANDILFLYDMEKLLDVDMKFSRPEFLYRDCQIYDISFMPNGNVLTILQKPDSCELLLCELFLDVVTKEAKIVGDIRDTRMKIEQHKRVVVTHDEEGAVLISFPIKMTKEVPATLELFHCTRYLRDKTGGKMRVPIVYSSMTETLVENAFISRNHVYFFNSLDYGRCIVLPVSGTQQGKATTLLAKGTPPPASFMGKVIQMFEEFVLIYACQDTLSTKKPAVTMYMLELTSFTYRPIHLTLSQHFPKGKVAFQKCGEGTVYLHGDCNERDCKEKRHLYGIDLSGLHVPRSVQSGGSVSSTSLLSINSLGSLASSTVAPAPPTPPVRYEKRRGRGEKKLMMKDRTKSLECISMLSSGSEDTNGNPVKRVPSLHWSSSMAEDGQTSLQDQLRLAKDMGFSDDVIMKAMKLNAKGEDYKAFENTNIMLDILNNAQFREGEPKLRLSVYNADAHKTDRPTSSRSLLSPRSASVSRSSSLNLGTGTSGSGRSSRQESHDINRLIATLDKEQERTKKEVEMQFMILKERIRHLESSLNHETQEKEKSEDQVRLTLNRLKDQEDNLRMERDENEKMRRELGEKRNSIDRITIENLRLHKELSDQKELAAHRKRQYEVEVEEKNREITSLRSQMSARTVTDERVTRLEEENKRMQETILSHSRSSTTLERERCEVIVERDELRERLGRAEGQITKCCICLEEKPSIVFFSCLHVCTCEECFRRESINKCPTCRAKIVGHSKIYF